MKMRLSLAFPVIFLSLSLFAQELPRADFENTFYMLPIFEHIRVPGRLSYEEKEEQLLKMKQELGEGNLYHRLGFSFIYGPSVDQPVRDACEIMEENGLHSGLIFDNWDFHVTPGHAPRVYIQFVIYRRCLSRQLLVYSWDDLF